MIEFKHNYVERNVVDLEISIKKYLEGANVNYVILENGNPLIWGGDKTPVIYGGKNDVFIELKYNCNAYLDEEKEILKEGWSVITELEFLVKYCSDWLEKILIKDIVKRGEKDGNIYRYYLDMNNTININGKYTDILCGHVGEDGILTFLISDTNDDYMDFVRINELPNDVIFNILMYILSD